VRAIAKAEQKLQLGMGSCILLYSYMSTNKCERVASSLGVGNEGWG
jgi:hypothetical protein